MKINEYFECLRNQAWNFLNIKHWETKCLGYHSRNSFYAERRLEWNHSSLEKIHSNLLTPQLLGIGEIFFHICTLLGIPEFWAKKYFQKVQYLRSLQNIGWNEFIPSKWIHSSLEFTNKSYTVKQCIRFFYYLIFMNLDPQDFHDSLMFTEFKVIFSVQ